MSKDTMEKLATMLKSLRELQAELQSLSIVLEDFKKRLLKRATEGRPLTKKVQDG